MGRKSIVRTVRVALLAVVTAGALGAVLLQLRAAEGQPAAVTTLGIQVLGPRELLVGSTAALRVVVTDYADGSPVARANVAVTLRPDGGGAERSLFRGRTDRRGTLRASFQIPDLEPGGYQLTVAARAGGQEDATTQSVTLKRSAQVLLTTDKPIYQPSQVIHIRALALQRPTLQAAAGRDLTLEVSDAKGNKVFKHTGKTNAYGILAADFALADEVNMGSYEVRALLGEDQATKTVTVKRYVLPKFKVVLSTDRGYYLPGETVYGTLQADYFFGKPVSEARVSLSVKTFDVEFTEIQKIEGQTDAQGTFKFECVLPDSFVGQPLEQGKAFLQFEAKVTDQAEHTEQAIHTSTVAASRLTINALPESGKLVPGVENIVYVLTALPTGEPARATVRLEGVEARGVNVTSPARDLRSDALGIAELPLSLSALTEPPRRPAAQERRGRWAPWMQVEENGATEATVTLKLAARLPDGTVARKEVELGTDAEATEGLLLRVDRPLARVGDRVEVTALCAADSGTVYFDLVKDRQTMLTRSADVVGGRATTDLRLTPELSGTVYVSAYRITPTGQIIRDIRPMFVEPADDLQVEVTADQETYTPGTEARLAFAVADREGRPVAAALGITVVDESVFALQELQPGMEKVFFYLEQELMKPRYEIHGLELPTLITHGPGTVDTVEQTQRAARVVFASVQAPDLNQFQVNTYQERLRAAKQEWARQMAPVLEAIQSAIQQYNASSRDPLTAAQGVETLIRRGLLKKEQLKDLWGNPLTIRPGGWDDKRMTWAVVICPGPDGKLNTLDDLILSSMSPGEWFEDEASAREMRRHVVFAMGLDAGAAPMAAAPMGLAGPKGGLGLGAAEELAPRAGGGRNGNEAATSPVRVREYFPETMFFEPSLITDEAGRASLTIPMADSITTWRLAAMANSAAGQLGSTTRGLRCFQDFFVDIDLPVSLTQNDQVSIPIAVYNYLTNRQTVRLELETDDWFELEGDATQTLEIAANDVEVRYFSLKVNKIGHHPLTVRAYGSHMSDAIKRSIDVVPDGRQVEVAANGRLRGTAEETIHIPAGAVAEASNILVKIYPGIFSQVVEGLDSILRMPFGCFEQTSSVTWPNIMVMDYMKTTRQITPEIQMKAAGFINTGYQRMLSYEVAGGGFSWFGDAPANKLLTAYGLMEFHDMSAVHPVDPNVITRTQQWLLSQADDKGVWTADKEYLHGETWGKMQVEQLLPTSYIVWALTHTGCKDPRLEQSAAYIRQNWKRATEPYTLAVVANALVGVDALFHEGNLSDASSAALRTLLNMAKTKGDQMWWESEISGITQSTGQSADIEATGMAVIALMRSGAYSAEASRVLNYLVASKDPGGTWYSTNATILALRALTMAQKGATSRTNGEMTVSVNGEQVSAFALTPEDSDVVRVVDCRRWVRPGDNTVRLQFAGEGSTLYQIVGRYYVPWEREKQPGAEPLSIDVRYDKTSLRKDDTVTAEVTVRNNTPLTTSMVIVDLGIPPGFSVDPAEFAELVGSKKIARYNMTGRQAIVYLEKLEPRQELRFTYTLKARFPIKAKTPKSTVYEYYNPDNRSDTTPVEVEVMGG